MDALPSRTWQLTTLINKRAPVVHSVPGKSGMTTVGSQGSGEGEIFQKIREDFSGVGPDLKEWMEFRYLVKVGAIHWRHGRRHKINIFNIDSGIK